MISGKVYDEKQAGLEYSHRYCTHILYRKVVCTYVVWVGPQVCGTVVVGLQVHGTKVYRCTKMDSVQRGANMAS